MRRRTVVRGSLVLAVMLAALVAGLNRQSPAQAPPGWLPALRQVHARFTGTPGTFAQLGDSITFSQAYWTSLQGPHRSASPAFEAAYQRVQKYLRPECWRDWKGPDYGNESGQTADWAQAHLQDWLHRLNPEVALIMFGTNDLRDTTPEVYGQRIRSLVQGCLANGTFVILSTIPPRHGYEDKAAAYAGVVRGIALEQRVPLIDFQAEILQRRPHDWDGSLPQFAAYQDYEVPTLISRDGIHPSFPARYQNDYSEDGLNHSGYTLRSYLTLMTYARVVEAMQDLPHAAAAPPAPAPTGADSHPTPAASPDTAVASPAPAGVPNPAASLALAAPPIAGTTPLSPPHQPWFPMAPLLPAPGGRVTRVSTVDGLLAAAHAAQPGDTILVADGLYLLTGRVELGVDHVTLRGASGDPTRVILDAGGRGEAVAVSHCTGATVADLTVQNVRWNGIKLDTDSGVQQATIYHCILHNIWQRAVKGVIVPPQDRDRIRPTGCRVQYCLFYNDHAKRYEDDASDTAENFRGNYIAGIDIMFARRWTISDNVFVGIQGRSREARGAVFLWQDAQQCVVERNVIIDCDSGICLGNSARSAEVPIHATGCIVRNNFITRAPEQGILADYTRDCKILNNTINDPENRQHRLMRLVHDDDGLLVANNLLCGPPLSNESQSAITFQHNLDGFNPALLVDAPAGNLRLTPRATAALGTALPLPEVPDDIDRHPRGPHPDIGAHQLSR